VSATDVAIACLEELGAELDKRGWQNRLVVAVGRLREEDR
jgi:hypothetical protein